MKRSVGIDWGNAKLSAAQWAPDESDASMVSTPDGPFLPSSIGFRTSRVEGRRVTHAVFPRPADWKDEHGTAITLRALKSGMPLYDDEEVQAVIADAIFGYWRKLIPGDEITLGVSVPFDYSWQLCQRLERRATAAGFTRCTCVAEPVAAVLAHLPSWQRDPSQRTAVRDGQLVWVVDCGLLDATLTLLHVKAQGVLTIELLAGNRFEGLGGDHSSALPSEQLTSEMESALPRLLATLTQAPRRGSARLPIDGAHWIVPVGGGTALESVAGLLASKLPKRGLMLSGVPAVEATARGCAVHAAQQAGAFAPQLSTVRRLLIGIKTEGALGSGFTAISPPDKDPPFLFERAFDLPEVTNEAVEVTLGVALPGGDLYTGLRTWAFERDRQTSAMPSRVLLVRGRLQDWSGGSVELVNPETGATITASEFRLP